MDLIIYEYLINNNNNNSIKLNSLCNYSDSDDNEVFLDCLLILSINKINVNYNNLIEYCDNIINNSTNGRKRNNNKQDDEIESSSCNCSNSYDIYYGLNEKQFQILFKIIKQLKNDKDSNDNDKAGLDQLVYNHTITTSLTITTSPPPSNNSSSNSISNNNNTSGLNKFDCSIVIIIHNNTILLQQQQQQQLNKNRLKKIKSNSGSRLLLDKQQTQQHQQQIVMTNKNGGYYDNNYLLFKKVWNNVVIRNEIKFHLKLFNVHSKNLEFNLDKFSNYKYKNYLRSVEINNGLTTFTSEHCKLISSSLDELYLTNFHSFENNSIPSTISKLVLGYGFNQKLTKNLYNNNNGNAAGGDNITELVFGFSFNQSLSVCVNNNNNNEEEQQQAWLPCNLTSLSFGSSFQQSIYQGQLPNSLTWLEFDRDYKGSILPHSIPKSVTSLDYTFYSEGNKEKLDSYSIPPSITKLSFGDGFDQDIKVGDIPHNVTSLTFGYYFNSNIAPGSLPQSLRSLKFGNRFNQPIGNDVLPCNLTSLSFGIRFNQPFTIENNRIFIPDSVTYLSFKGVLNHTIGVNTFKNFKNLKTLIFKDYSNKSSGIIEPNSLTNTITTLDLSGYQGPIDNRLPTSLTSLKLTYNYNHDNLTTLPPNTLPQSITTLYISKTLRQPIQSSISNLIPPNLKSIYIRSGNDHDLSSIDWPESLESIYIPYNSDIINSLPTHFFKKYIKIIK